MSTVLVTGGAGFMGSHLVERLLEEGVAVRILDNLSTGSLGNLQGVVERFHGQGEGPGGVAHPSAVVEHVRDGLPGYRGGARHILDRYLTCGRSRSGLARSRLRQAITALSARFTP